MAVKNIIFDFDGVVADSLSHLVTIANGIGPEFGLPQLDAARVRSTGLSGLIKCTKMPSLKIPFFARKLRQGFQNATRQIGIHSGMGDTLRELAGIFKLGILTSNTAENVEDFLNRHGVAGLFTFHHYGCPLFAKDSAIGKLLARNNLDKDETVYVGDEVRDIVAMKKARVPIIAVSWGYEGEELLKAQSPQYLATTPRHLYELACSLKA